MIKKILDFVEGISRRMAAFISLLMILILGIIDHFSGHEIDFSIFYLIPLALTAWTCRRSTSIFMSILSALMWMSADLGAGSVYTQIWIPVWNAIMRLIIFLIITAFIRIIRKQLQHLEELAQTDPLTGIANRRHFCDQLFYEVNKLIRFKRPLTIAYIDIDNFKHVNDSFGHLEGDNLLISVSSLIQKNIRSTDIAARLGGDEFAIVLPETDEEQAEVVINKIYGFFMDKVKEKNLAVSFSIGVVTYYNIKDNDIEELINTADKLMYSIKRDGKNKVAYKIMDMEEHLEHVSNELF